MLPRPCVILGAVALFGTPLAAQNTLHCDNLQVNEPGDAVRAFDCLEKAQSDLITAQERIDALESRMGDLAALAARIEALETSAQSQTAVPALGDHPDTRAVVAYTSAKGEKSCPAGWEPFEAAKDRFILGAGAAYPVVGTLGGAAEVTLSVAHMPEHKHRSILQWGLSVNGNGSRTRLDLDDGAPWEGRVGTIETNAVGGGQPHNNMPPYIALYFCQSAG